MNRLLCILGALLLLALGTACSRPEPQAEPVRTARTLLVEPRAVGGTQEFAAEIRARHESRLAFRVGGKMVSRSAEVGQRVRRGDVLARLDPADLKLAQDAARASAHLAEVNLELAKADFQRYKELRDQGFISAAELERRETTLKAARAQVEQALAQAGVQGNQAGYAVLTADVAGVVVAVEAEAGAVLAAGTPVVRIAEDGPRDVVFSVPENAVDGIRQLIGRPGALVVRSWASNAQLPANIREVSAAADNTTRTFLVKADLGAATLQLGQSATAVLQLPRMEGVARLPLTAVRQFQGKPAVWVVDTNSSTVRSRPVSLGEADGNDVIVTAGLKPGERVVTAGVHVLTEGQAVKLMSGDGPGAAPTSPASSATAQR